MEKVVSEQDLKDALNFVQKKHGSIQSDIIILVSETKEQLMQTESESEVQDDITNQK